MGNFLIVLASAADTPGAEQLHSRGICVARELKHQSPAVTARYGSHIVTAFARQNGSSGKSVSHAASGAWLLAVGTWFHSEGYGVGQEDRLLQALLSSDAKRVAREMEGFFVIAFGSAKTAEATVFTDTMGSCHAYRRQFGDITVVAGSSLVLAALYPASADAVGIQEFVQTGIAYEDRSHFSEVKKLNPATICRFSGGRLSVQSQYWSYADLKPAAIKGREAVDAFWQSLKNAATNISRHFTRVSCDLTGGYDSRCVLASFFGAHLQICAAVSGSGEKIDVQVAKSLAAAIGVPIVHTLPLQQVGFDYVCTAHALTDGEFDPIEYAQILHVQAGLSKNFDISLNGSYGGIARSLWWELLFPHLGERKPLDAKRLAQGRYISPHFEPGLFRSDIRISPATHLPEVVRRYLAGLENAPNTMQMDAVNLAMRIHRWQGRIASSTHQVWSCLSPLGLRSVLEVVLESDFKLRWRSNLVRQMLAAHQPVMADFILDRGYPAAPVTIRNFYRFAPVFTHFASRGVSKILRTISLGSSCGVGGSSPREQLWRDDRVKTILNPKNMKSAPLFDSGVLATFLEKSQQSDFAFTTQWNRLLSLELSFAALDKFGSSVRCPGPG